MPVAELRSIAKERGLKGTNTLRKSALIELLSSQASIPEEQHTDSEDKKPETHKRGRQPKRQKSDAAAPADESGKQEEKSAAAETVQQEEKPAAAETMQQAEKPAAAEPVQQAEKPAAAETVQQAEKPAAVESVPRTKERHPRKTFAEKDTAAQKNPARRHTGNGRTPVSPAVQPEQEPAKQEDQPAVTAPVTETARQSVPEAPTADKAESSVHTVNRTTAAGRINTLHQRRMPSHRMADEVRDGQAAAPVRDRYVRPEQQTRQPFTPAKTMQERTQQERLQQERSQQERGQQERPQQERFQQERTQQDRIQQERSQPERIQQDRAQQERSMAEQRAQEDKRPANLEQLDSGETKEGILEVMADGFGFLRCDNFLPGEDDVYVSPAQIRRFGLKTGDIVRGNTRIKNANEKFSALLYVKTINDLHPSEAARRPRFEDLTPIFPNQRISLQTDQTAIAMRMVDLIAPIGKGQRGMIVSPPKAGKTTLLKAIAKAITTNYPEMMVLILLIDERPEEVTDIKESIQGSNVQVIYSTFDELPENHKRVSEMVIERAKRLVEHKQDVVILLDSITRLARAYNLTVTPSGRTLSGGLDPAALYMPKRFFGAARNMREGGSLTILATALIDTGSRMDDVVFEEFKGTGNMELVLDRKLSERRVFPAIDLAKSGTRRDDLLLSKEEMEATFLMRKALNGLKSDQALERIIEMFVRTRNNEELIQLLKKVRIVD